ncbi:MAG: PolC-type DNA polymerase III [Clostridia bacterium]|nr:PolC-type DNA polymerase III [Clostridia bacterium]
MSTVFVIIPSDDRAHLQYVFECAGMKMPAAISHACRIAQIEANLDSGEWRVRIEGKTPDDAHCSDLARAALRRVLGDVGEITVDFCGTHQACLESDAVSSEWIEEHWRDVVDKVCAGAPYLGAWLAEARCVQDEGELAVEVPGEVQAAKLTEKGCSHMIAAAIAELSGARPEVRIVVGDFTATDQGDDEESPDAWVELASPPPPGDSEQRPAGDWAESKPRTTPTRTETEPKRRGRRRPVVTAEGAIRGRLIAEAPQSIAEIAQGQKKAVVAGELFDVDERQTKSGLYVISFCITDLTDSITCKFFRDADEPRAELADGQWVKVRGELQYDQYARETVIMASDIVPYAKRERMDLSAEKRVELHLHTKMSALDSVCEVQAVIRQAAAWGHPAVAITDHGVVQAFPDAYAEARKLGIKVIYGMEAYLVDDPADDGAHMFHMTVLARNRDGLQGLYHLVTDSHLRYFHRHPRVPREAIAQYRSGLLIGSACESGELFRAMLANAPDEEIQRIAGFYDYLEVMPPGNNAFLVRSGALPDVRGVQNLTARIHDLGRKLGIPVVATGDVHFLNPRDEVYRRILMAGQGYEDADSQAPLYFHTTDEMLEEFSFLGEEICREVVIENPRKIAGMIDDMKPVPDELATPEIEGADDEVRSQAHRRAKELYGDPLPETVADRLGRELDAIIGHGYAVNYDIAAKLVRKSVEAGYPVGSRGSVGSSLVATMCGITEVNPLPPHYLCPSCHYSDFDHGLPAESGYDLPSATCPQCGCALAKDGQNIPFETFLGFEGDKVPDIDLNFSGEYQGAIHKYAEELFGADHVFRAGTIATIADKTAYGFVKAYAESHGLVMRQAEAARLARGCSGVKRTTGQHPGGLMIVPKGRDVHEFTPVQHPANDRNSETVTTHFEYKTIHECLLKLDLLGHDDPTMIKMLEDLTGMRSGSIPMDDPETIAIFASIDPLKLRANPTGLTCGTVAIPEFGTKFVRGMLDETKPRSFADLVRISGLSHGTDVWLTNAQELIAAGRACLSDVIACRDDIMIRLIRDGLPPKTAFKIMEKVRKGKGLTDEDAAAMKGHSVPDWYINSCNKIKYMFPKAHAAAYVTMAFRIAYFKVHYPIQFYAAYFSIRAAEFEAQIATMSVNDMIAAMDSIETKADATSREKNLTTVLEVVAEAKLRGVEFLPVSIGSSEATRFSVEDGALRIPLVTVSSLGEAAAASVIDARCERPFSSIADVRGRTRLTRSHIDALREMGGFDGLPETDQLSLF